MADDGAFRLITIAIAFTLIPIGAYHRIRAARGEKISRREEGLALMILLRISGLAAWIVIILYMIHPPWVEWSRVGLPAWLRWCGAVCGIGTVPLLYWVFHSLGKNVTDTVVTRQEHTLVTHGPYRWVRHPLYAVIVPLCTGITLVSGNWFFGAAGALAFILIVARSSIEEAKLIERFGDDYRAYMERTGRFFPHLRTRIT